MSVPLHCGRWCDGCRSAVVGGRANKPSVLAKRPGAMDNANLAGHPLAEMPKTPRSSPNPARVIEMLAFPAVQLLDVTGPVQVFASANDLVTQAGGAAPYLVRVVAQGGGSV